VQQAAAEPPSSEPVANQSITAPKQMPDRHSAFARAPEEAAPPAEPAQQKVPLSPQPVATPAKDSGRNLTGKDPYVVRPGGLSLAYRRRAAARRGGHAGCRSRGRAAVAAERKPDRDWRSESHLRRNDARASVSPCGNTAIPPLPSATVKPSSSLDC
jgi:hypothetical protein